MGRPLLNVEATKVRLSKDAKQRIVALVGERQIAAFIRHAVETELRWREAMAAKKPDPIEADS